MPPDRLLVAPPGYDVIANPRVTSFAAQLDDQLALLKNHVASLETAQLEWQPHPGVNTVGMLLAHLAIVDVWWITIAPKALSAGPEADVIFKSIIGMGMDDDGMPCAKDGRHPSSLNDKPLAFYLDTLDRARASSHKVMRELRDTDLASTFTNRQRVISREWTLYHVLEHFSGHYGQVLLLMHLMRDAGVLADPQPR
jgi:uncharacterized damage-inducible protein DinB